MLRTAVLALMILSATAGSAAAATLRPPTEREERGIVARLEARGHDLDKLDRICVHRAHSRYAVARFQDVEAGFEGVVLRRREERWRYVTGGSNWSGGPVLRALLRRDCKVRPDASAEALGAGTVLGADGSFGPVRLGMTEGGAQRATRSVLVFDSFNPPCGTFMPRRLQSFSALTTNGIVRRYSITTFGEGSPRLATAEGLRIGDPAARVTEVYGPPTERDPAPYDPQGEQLTYDLAPPLKRVVLTSGEGEVVEVRVGLEPEVGFIEGCA
jgi:hypothetical protein